MKKKLVLTAAVIAALSVASCNSKKAGQNGNYENASYTEDSALVEKDGSVTKVKVLRGVDPSLDKEAVRVVSMSPKWKPGKQRDRAVPVTYTFPVYFQLR